VSLYVLHSSPTHTHTTYAHAPHTRRTRAAHAHHTRAHTHTHATLWRCLQTRIKRLLNHQVWQAVVSIVTIFALYGDDIRLLALPKTADVVFHWLSFFALLLFVSEMSMQSYSVQGYKYSFDFWLDFVSTFSLIPDIAFLWELIIGAEEDGGSASAVLSASRASRAGTRAIRIVRIVRLVRMVRIVKLLNQLRRKDKGPSMQTKEVHSKVGAKLLKVTTRRVIVLVLTMVLFLPFFDGGLDSQYNQFQNFGLSELHRMPQDYNMSGNIDIGTFRKQFEEYARNAGKLFYIQVCTDRCATIWPLETTNSWLKDMRFQKLDESLSTDRAAPFTESTDPVTGFHYSQMLDSEQAVRELYRAAERPKVVSAGCYMTCTEQRDDPWSNGMAREQACEFDPSEYSDDSSTGFGVTSLRYAGCYSTAYFDNRAETRWTAGMNLLKTTFVMFVLAGGILGVDKDAQKLVIKPIKRMVQMIQRLATDPLSKASSRGDDGKDGEDEGDEAEAAGTSPRGGGGGSGDKKKKKKKKKKHAAGADSYETHIIEETLAKVGQLMQVGFGAAGAEIIKQNLKSGSFNPMLEGKRITAIYMFCDIRSFTDTTECLQEDVMVYVNRLGALCHGVTVGYYGMANKNVGDAFLLSWKLCDGDLAGFSHFDQETAQVDNMYNPCPPHAGHGEVDRVVSATEMADSALVATIKICNDLALANVDGNLVEFITRDSVVKRFGKNFTIRMGYGIHVGWCIEGAIGSLHKIDCTYLSPHVELSDRLEAGSKIFKTPINLSHWFVRLLSPAARKFLRMVRFLCACACACCWWWGWWWRMCVFD
jgi:class 3 adenylate cyclase